MYRANSGYDGRGAQGGHGSRVVLDASRQVPTAPENRPVNIAVYTCISY